MTEQRFRLPGSSLPKPNPIAPVDTGERLTATIYLRPDPSGTPTPGVNRQARLAPRARTYLRPEEAVGVYGAAEADLAVVAAFAREHHLELVERSIEKRIVRVAGTVASLNEAFGVVLSHYELPGGARYSGHDRDVELPVSLAGVVEGVLGLGNRRIGESYLRKSRKASAAKGHGAVALPANTYTPPTVAALFDFPEGDGSGECIAVLAFNGQVMSTGESTSGGYDRGALEGYFTDTLGQAVPKIVDVVVQGPGNQPGDGSGGDSTGEVLLDLCTVGSVASGADIAVYFTEFTEEGWVNAIKAAVADLTNKPSVISISYGNGEDEEAQSLWTATAIQLINGAFQQAAAQGITICCASGDSGSGDEPNASTDHVDFPASSPWVLGCGGTRLEADASTSTISAEQVWNDLADGNGATGGGVSRLFGVPDWQATANVPPNADGSGKTGRGVPDVAALADPETPLWVLGPDGQPGGVGGTSAAAPMWAALIARLNQGTQTRLGFCNPQLYANLKSGLVDIVNGDNGAYSARPGWDACTGWGRPDGQGLLQALTTASPISNHESTPPVQGSESNIVGPEGRLFADPQPGSDETSFQVDNTSAEYYKSPYYKLHEAQLQSIPPPRVSPSQLDLSQLLSATMLAPILAGKRISFHTVGDTGPDKKSGIAHEASVADALTQALEAATTAEAPAFLFHLGDVVYDFGEARYYYDQFYEPFRGYDRPILAIPGNHDGEVIYGPTASGGEAPEAPTLQAFLGNFCSASPGTSPNAGSLIRSTMTQPGVYFTLDAPLVSIIGLYSNVLEGPGVISSEGGKYPTIGDEQLQFLIAELTRLKPQREAGERAVLLACHHPPVSADAKHGGTTGLAEDIDRASQQAGLRPDMVLSGHAHLYQRFTRSVDGTEIPYIVAGTGGHGLTHAKKGSASGSAAGEYTLVVDPIEQYGYVTVTVDMSGQAPTLSAVFTTVGKAAGVGDSVTVDLTTRKLV